MRTSTFISGGYGTGENPAFDSTKIVKSLAGNPEKSLDLYALRNDRMRSLCKIDYFAGGEVRPQNEGRLSVRLTFIDEHDEAVLKTCGITWLRRLRIYRLSNEASDQGYRMTYEDLLRLLLTSSSTLKRDIAFLRNRGYPVPLRKAKTGNMLQKANERICKHD